MLNQAAGDRQILAKQLNISPYQLSYVTNSGFVVIKLYSFKFLSNLSLNGSLKVFNHRTNVELNNRIVCFDIRNLESS